MAYENERIYKICDAIDSELTKNHIHAEVYPFNATLPVVCVKINWGDWKHDHWFAKDIVTGLGHMLFDSTVTEQDGSDCFSAIHRFIVKQ